MPEPNQPPWSTPSSASAEDLIDFGAFIGRLQNRDPEMAAAVNAAVHAVARSRQPDPESVGYRTTLTGRAVPELARSVAIVVDTPCPRKFALVDMESGKIWVRRVVSPEEGALQGDTPALRLAMYEDCRDIEEAVKAMNTTTMGAHPEQQQGPLLYAPSGAQHLFGFDRPPPIDT